MPVEYGAESIVVELDNGDLSTDNPDQPNAAELLTHFDVERVSSGANFASFRDAVASTIYLRLRNGETDLDGAAARLGVGPRTFQMKIEAEGTSYRSVLRAVQQIRARDLLSESTAPIETVAKELGYSSSSHFDRAFSDWTGMSPSQFRNAST